MNCKKSDITEIVNRFKSQSNKDDRYRSYDYCYNYFKNTEYLTKDIEKSCLTLGFYLASWGMYRGSSFILQKSLFHYKETIIYLNDLKKSDAKVWEIDIDKYDNDNIEKLIKIYNQICGILVKSGDETKKHRSITLVTKLMLGVFGSVPAFDNYFIETFSNHGKCKFKVFNKNSLFQIKDFYDSNYEEIDALSNSIKTLDFLTGEETPLNYTKAKIIDMYGFGKSYPNISKKIIHEVSLT